MNNEKTCSTCKISQPYINFFKNKGTKDGHRPDCKACRKIYQLNNKEKIKNQKRRHYLNNKDEIYKKVRTWCVENKERVSNSKRAWYQKDTQRYVESSRIRRKYKYKTDNAFKINNSISGGIGHSLRSNGANKCNRSWKDLVDYTIDELKLHLESKFDSLMSWENYGKFGWHIDHIIPKSLFKFDSPFHPAFKACWSLDNLQPLWAKDNLKKNNRVILTKEQEDLLKLVNI